MKSIPPILLTAIVAVSVYSLPAPHSADDPRIRRIAPLRTAVVSEQVDPVLDFVVSEVISEDVRYPAESLTIPP